MFFIHPELAALLPEAERSFDGFLAIGGTEMRAREGRRTARFTRAGRTFFVKQHRGVGWGEILKNLTSLRLPALSARGEWEASLLLQAAGVSTPTILAGGVRGRNPARRRSFLVTAALEDTLTLEELTRDWVHRRPEPALKRRLIEEVAETARRMHAAGVTHRDFYLCHFRRPRAGGRLHLMDLHRAKIATGVHRRWIVKDLGALYSSASQIGLTRRDLYRFMRAYAQRPLRQVLAEEKRLWADIARNKTALQLRGRHPVVGALLLRFRLFGLVYRSFLAESTAR